MRFFALYFFLFFSMLVKAQNVYTKQNIWLAFNGQYTTSKYRFVLDGGNRSFDHFYRKNRTSLVRMSLGYKVYQDLFVGLGFASFYHFTYKENDQFVQNELRPFIQVNYFKNIHSGLVRFRFRNEFRYFKTSGILKNRSRLQLIYLHHFRNRVKLPVVQYEGFVSPDNKVFHEHRLQLGLQYELNRVLSISPYYMFQLQSNNPYLQNIIGLTLQYTKLHGV
jgi:hypothetical protein